MQELNRSTLGLSDNIYLSTPYSHEDPDIERARFEMSNQVAWLLMQTGAAVFSPITHSHTLEEQVGEKEGHAFWMNQDLSYLQDWSNILVLITAGGWRESSGVAKELEEARANNIPILTFDPLRQLDLVGLSGKKRSGKDTLGDVFAQHGYQKYALADPIKDAAQTIFNFSDAQLNGDRKEEEDPYWNRTPREVMQHFGTDAFRSEYGPDVWVDSLFQRLRFELPLRAVVTDVRFPNEVTGVQEVGGDVIRIDASERLSSSDGHASETALDGYEGYDRVVQNNDSLDAFIRRGTRLVEQYYV